MILETIKCNSLTYEQKIITLARLAENSLNVLNKSEKLKEYMEKNIICDLMEGEAPYRPRYIVPDYDKFMKQGSKFLGLDTPTNIWEAVNNLLILYKHVPSITTMPVYLGNIDYLLDPFITDENEAYLAIKLFLKHVDSTITDSFCHANIGPLETKAGRIILKVMRELQLPTPNLTLKYDESTSKALALDSIETALSTAKPSFANNKMFEQDFKGEYGIVSCYNGLKVGGGANTLIRIKLGTLAKEAQSIEDFFTRVLPDVTAEVLTFIDERSRFLIDESGFFESSFLVKEGLIEKEKFTGLFGVVGLAECVNHLLSATEQKERFGYSEIANELGEKIIKTLYTSIENHKSKYAGSFFNNSHLLHSQVGIDTDVNESPGCRIPIGEEPELLEHILQSAPFHKYCPSGIGDIFIFDQTYNNNIEAILDIIKGAFANEMRFFSLYGSDSDVVRVTGYLVKKSEMAKLDRGEQVLRDTTILGKGARDNAKALERRLRYGK
ncbi:YjjI family glycine radical enzyme [Fusobacterium sp.]|uniref:YjjI family glycine radical enzyme n=2 Tax=unclassified Fusobacterium TaxID=2648384 RepID=UPI0026220C61|nr:YjjI family glycine radical enzyme [Fusobacterium sp.]